MKGWIALRNQHARGRLRRRVGPLAALLVLTLGIGLAKAEVTQQGNLRLAVDAHLAPHTLPRRGTAPVSVSVSGRVSTTDGSMPPQLRRMVIEINKHGSIDGRGLPICRFAEIQPATNNRALRACRGSLVGTGKFVGTINLPGHGAYPMLGRLLVFNGRFHGKPTLLGHIFSAHPFATSFVIPFQVIDRAHGQFGTALVANVARALGNKRNLTSIELTLSRRFHYRGAARSFVSAGCPAAKGFHSASFKLARTSFSFAGGAKLTESLVRTCGARG